MADDLKKVDVNPIKVDNSDLSSVVEVHGNCASAVNAMTPLILEAESNPSEKAFETLISQADIAVTKCTVDFTPKVGDALQEQVAKDFGNLRNAASAMKQAIEGELGKLSAPACPDGRKPSNGVCKQ